MRAGVGSPRVGVLACAAAREKLCLRWGPEQVAGAAAVLVIGASTIRRRIKADWARTRGNLRRRGKPCLSRAERRAQARNRIPNRVHFSQRPPQADACAQRGHWEIDTLLDPGALVLADRATRQIVRFPLPRANARARADASSPPSPPTTAASSPGTPASPKPPARRSSSPNPTPRNSAEHVKTPSPWCAT